MLRGKSVIHRSHQPTGTAGRDRTDPVIGVHISRDPAAAMEKENGLLRRRLASWKEQAYRNGMILPFDLHIHRSAMQPGQRELSHTVQLSLKFIGFAHVKLRIGNRFERCFQRQFSQFQAIPLSRRFPAFSSVIIIGDIFYIFNYAP